MSSPIHSEERAEDSCATSCSRECKACGAEFEAITAEVAGVTIDPFRFCDACMDSARAQDAAKAISRRLCRFRGVCPPNFLKSDTSRFPAVWRAVEKWDPDTGRGFGLVGAPGSCKTRILWTIAKRLAQGGEFVRAVTHSELQTMAQHQWTEDNLEQIERLKNCRILLLDDLGKGRMRGESLAKLWDIIDARAGKRRPILWTSNLGGRQLAAMIGDGLAGPMLGRLADAGDVFDIDGNKLGK